MPTKVKEACPKCQSKILPTDTAIEFTDSSYGNYPVRLWRYECHCGWIWANFAQRKHNTNERHKARRQHENMLMYGSFR